MAGHLTLGQWGENKAAELLTAQGYQILARNYRAGQEEIDIICRKAKILHFVEVKTRTEGRFKVNEWGLHSEKLQHITNAAYEYIYEKEWKGEFQFDVITIARATDGSHRITHYKDAFFPGLEGI